MREYATPADRWARALSKLVLDFPGLPIDHALPKRDLKYRLSWVRALYLVRSQIYIQLPEKCSDGSPQKYVLNEEIVTEQMNISGASKVASLKLLSI